MNFPRPSSLFVTLLAAGSLTLGGCATQKYVRTQVGAVDAKVQTQQGALQTHETRLGELDRTTREALQRADAAGKLAQGKFLYEMVLSDDSVKFPASGAQLSEEAKTRLMDLALKMKGDNKNIYLEIQGHTDNIGSKPGNMRLGEARAEAVRRFMNQQGVALNRMATISYGDEAPAVANTTRAGRAQNRRVVVIVLT